MPRRTSGFRKKTLESVSSLYCIHHWGSWFKTKQQTNKRTKKTTTTTKGYRKEQSFGFVVKQHQANHVLWMADPEMVHLSLWNTVKEERVLWSRKRHNWGSQLHTGGRKDSHLSSVQAQVGSHVRGGGITKDFSPSLSSLAFTLNIVDATFATSCIWSVRHYGAF